MSIAVNLVTGFLGTGKTTAIRHLLRAHASAERWGVLVNEFGEVGVDGALLDGDGVAVQEVAGGCLCCVSAPAFATGLNRLIRQRRPDRILIEPSGLGHPAQVLATLTGPLYRDVLDVRATVCIMDARHLQSPRHREHPTFVDQIHLADVLVANKADLYSAIDLSAFEEFVWQLKPPKLAIGIVEYGRVDIDWLNVGRDSGRRAAFPESHAFLVDSEVETHAQDARHWILIEGTGDGYRRASWSISQRRPWRLAALRGVFSALGLERIKGVLHTDAGWMALNDDTWQDIRTPGDARSRLVLIDTAAIPARALDRSLRELDDGDD